MTQLLPVKIQIDESSLNHTCIIFIIHNIFVSVNNCRLVKTD